MHLISASERKDSKKSTEELMTEKFSVLMMNSHSEQIPIRKIKGGAPGWSSQFSIQLSILAQVMISQLVKLNQQLGPCCQQSLLGILSLSPSALLSLSQNKYTLKKKKRKKKK